MLALAVFAVQNYVIQTHIHFAQVGHQHVRLWQAAGHQSKALDDDPATCPLCQDMALSGHFTSPGAILLILPLAVAIVAALFATAQAPALAPRHGWQGRAPPGH